MRRCRKKILEQRGSRSFSELAPNPHFPGSKNLCQVFPVFLKKIQKGPVFLNLVQCPKWIKSNISKSSNISCYFPLRPAASRSPCLHRRAIPKYPCAQRSSKGWLLASLFAIKTCSICFMAGYSSTTPPQQKKWIQQQGLENWLFFEFLAFGNHLFVWRKIYQSLLSAGMESSSWDALTLPVKHPWAVDGSAPWWIPIRDHPSF